MHLSQIGEDVRYGFLGDIDVAIVRHPTSQQQGDIVLSTSVEILPTLIQVAHKVIIELNEAHASKLTGMHDIYIPDAPPYRREIPIYRVNDRAGSISVRVNPEKVVNHGHESTRSDSSFYSTE